MVRFPFTAYLLVVAFAFACGCTESEPAPVTDSTPAAKAEVRASEKQQDAAAKARAELEQAMVEYIAPYPDRGDLFVPPKSAPRAASSSTREGNVVLRGLVNVGEPQAVLDIEGATALVSEGGEKYGVKVLKIDERKVTLARGATQWTTSLD